MSDDPTIPSASVPEIIPALLSPEGDPGSSGIPGPMRANRSGRATFSRERELTL